MTVMIAEVYDAFKSAGAEDDKARKAAEAMASYETRYTEIKGELALLRWMVGVNIGFSAAILLKAFF